MDYKPFGRTGVNVSPLILGCMMFGQKTDIDETRRIVDCALDAGINFLDTANVYGGGLSEEFTGEALSRDGKRDRVFLATKVHQRMSPDPNGLGNSRLHIVEQCEASLRRLKTDHIDLYQLHRPDPHIAIDETLRAFDDLVRDGKVRYFGTSNFGAWQIVEGLWASKELGLNRFVSDQSPFSLADRRAEREQIPMCQTFSLAFIPWSPLGGGGLSGKYRRGVPLWRRDRPGKAEAFLGGSRRHRRANRPARRGPRMHCRPVRARMDDGPAGRHRAHHRAAHAGAVRGQPGRDRRRVGTGGLRCHGRGDRAGRVRGRLLRGELHTQPAPRLVGRPLTANIQIASLIGPDTWLDSTARSR